MLYDQTTLGNTSVDLIGPSGSTGGLAVNSLDGFTVLLQGGVSSTPGGGLLSTPASITQVGLVPPGSKSIIFIGNNDTSGILSLSLNGVNIPYFGISNAPNYTVYQGDISAFAGQTGELQFLFRDCPVEPRATG